MKRAAWTGRAEARFARRMQHAGSASILEDASFDAELPRRLRDRSSQYWTPVAVASRVAAIFSEHRVSKILDVGCGPGKFCIVAGCQEPGLVIHGMDQRARLVRVGAGLARKFGAHNVRIWLGDVTKVPWHEYHGFYFFNPFAENVFQKCDRFDDDVHLSALRFAHELLRVERLLEQARAGTVVVTYHGLGGPIPPSYELVTDEPAGSDRIRTWVHGVSSSSGWVWLEMPDRVARVSRSRLHSALASLICGTSRLAPAGAGSGRALPEPALPSGLE